MLGTPLNQNDLDNATINDLLLKNNRKLLKEFRDRTDPPLDPAIKAKANDGIIALEKAYILAKANMPSEITLKEIKDYPTAEEGGPPLSPEAEAYKQQKIAEVEAAIAARKFIPDAFNATPTPTQKDIDLAEVQKMILENDLVGLKRMRDRTEPPLDPEVKAKILEAIAAIEAARAAALSDPDWEIGKPGGVFKPQFKFPPIASQNLVGPTFRESFSGGGAPSGIVRPKAPKLPPKEELIGQNVVLPKNQKADKGLLTDEGWRQLKNLGINILKYTGMYVAPAVLAGVAYQYSKNQPDGTLLRSLAELMPAPKYGPQQFSEYQAITNKIGNLLTATADLAKGTTPGKPGGPMLTDVAGTLLGPTPGPFEDLETLKNIERISNWGVAERQLINDVFPKAPSVLSMEIDDFPVVQYRNTDVANYATQSNGTITANLITAAVQSLANRLSPSTTPTGSLMSLESLSKSPATVMTDVVMESIFPGVQKRRPSSVMESQRKRPAFGSRSVGGKRVRL